MDGTKEIVTVVRHPGDWRTADYLLENISDLHWSNASGGVQKNLNRVYLCGYVWCDEMEEGELAHSCLHGEGPHQIKVVVQKNHNSKTTYKKLAGIANGEMPTVKA